MYNYVRPIKWHLAGAFSYKALRKWGLGHYVGQKAVTNLFLFSIKLT